MPFLETLGLKWVAIAAGFFGALISLKFIEGLGPWSRASTVLGGTAVAAFCSPLAVEVLELSPKSEGAFAFLLGLFGMSLAGKLMQEIPEWISAARERWVSK